MYIPIVVLTSVCVLHIPISPSQSTLLLNYTPLLVAIVQ